MNLSLYRITLLLGIIMAGISSCYSPRYMYSQSIANTPDFKKKGDSKAAVYYATGTRGTRGVKAARRNDFYNRGFDLQGAYALSNHIAIIGSQSNRYERNDGDFRGLVDSSDVVYRRSMTEIGGGWYTNSRTRALSFQALGGAGLGRFRFTDNGFLTGNQPFSRFHDARVTKLFFQPSLILRPGNNFSTMLSGRISGIFFNRIRTNYTEAEKDAFLLNNLEQDARVFWETSVINNFGFREIPGIRVEIHLGFTNLISKRFIDYRTFNFGIGLTADIRKLRG
jgi:hypothetical protein